MNKFNVVCNFKDGYGFTTEEIGSEFITNKDVRPYLEQLCIGFLNGLIDNRKFNYVDNDGNKHPYNYDDLASITINFVGEDE